MGKGRGGEAGIALAAALLLTLLLLALASGLMLTAVGETAIAGHHRHGVEAWYGAEAAAALAVDGLEGDDWAAALEGRSTSAFVDGAPEGVRIAAGGPLDLAAATAAVRQDRPWGATPPVWQPYVYGPLRDLLGVDSDLYVVAWVAEGPAGGGIPAVLARAYGLSGTRRTVEVTLGPGGPGRRLRRLSWREVP